MKNPIHTLHENHPRIWALAVFPLVVLFIVLCVPFILVYETAVVVLRAIKEFIFTLGYELRNEFLPGSKVLCEGWTNWWYSLRYGNNRYSKLIESQLNGFGAGYVSEPTIAETVVSSESEQFKKED